MKALRSLLVTTSNKTGVWLEDLAAPYFILKDGGEYITVASPAGGQVPLDIHSGDTEASTKNSKRFVNNAQAMYHFSHSLPLNEIKPADYDLVCIAGGWGAMHDLNDNKELNHILAYFNIHNKPVGLIGHGTVALISLSTEAGEPFVKDRKLTGFSNTEESTTGLNEKPPFLLQSKLVSLGALYSKGFDFTSYVVIDGNIVTGQNPASSVETAKQLLSMAHNHKEDTKKQGVASFISSIASLWAL